MSDFTRLGLPEVLVRAAHECGYTVPTPIQQQAIPFVLQGRDVLAAAQTGTGKTAAFLLPILARLLADPRRPTPRAPRALILTPTRELAAQIEASFRDYARHAKLSALVVFGGVGINPQIDRLERGVDVLVATPGRLLDLAGQRAVSLAGIEYFVLDEADRMLDMGFIRDIRKVLALLPPRRQNLLFSATFPAEIVTLAQQLLHAPERVEVARSGTSPVQIRQRVCVLDKSRKRDALIGLVRDGNWFQVLVFTRTKHGANRLAEQLDKAGIPALAIHGNKSQNARTRALGAFKAGELQVLVATDIAARGIDIDELPHVVNYELPQVPEDYVHRIGRTGRAGAEGEAYSLVCQEEFSQLAAIEKLLGRRIERLELPGMNTPNPATTERVPERRHSAGRDSHAPGAARRPGDRGTRAPGRSSRTETGNRPGPGRPR
ncbi:MAG: DEAD/DEAH box helicase [Gammaproteobacteria bacterium]